MVVISDEITNIFKILDMNVNTEQDLFSALVSRDLLLRVDIEHKLTELITSLKGKYKTSKLNCLHKNRDDKQKFPGINLVRQILRCNGYHLKPVIYSRGYCKHSGKKIVDRNFKIIRLDNFSEIKQAEFNETKELAKLEELNKIDIETLDTNKISDSATVAISDFENQNEIYAEKQDLQNYQKIKILELNI